MGLYSWCGTKPSAWPGCSFKSTVNSGVAYDQYIRQNREEAVEERAEGALFSYDLVH